MKRYDQGSSLFWLIIAIFVFNESLHLGTGTFRNPGMGFMALGASGMLGILSLTLFIKTTLEKEEVKAEPLFSGKLWKRVPFALIALLTYVKLMPVLGYLISTFLLMSFLFWIVRGSKWWWVLILSSLTTIISYCIFSKWLNCQFPQGLFGL